MSQFRFYWEKKNQKKSLFSSFCFVLFLFVRSFYSPLQFYRMWHKTKIANFPPSSTFVRSFVRFHSLDNITDYIETIEYYSLSGRKLEFSLTIKIVDNGNKNKTINLSISISYIEQFVFRSDDLFFLVAVVYSLCVTNQYCEIRWKRWQPKYNLCTVTH